VPPIVALAVLTLGVFPCESSFIATQPMAPATSTARMMKPQMYRRRRRVDFDACAGAGDGFRAGGRGGEGGRGGRGGRGADAGGTRDVGVECGTDSGAACAGAYSSSGARAGAIEVDSGAACAGTYSSSGARAGAIEVVSGAACAGTYSSSAARAGAIEVDRVAA